MTMQRTTGHADWWSRIRSRVLYLEFRPAAATVLTLDSQTHASESGVAAQQGSPFVLLDCAISELLHVSRVRHRHREFLKYTKGPTHRDFPHKDYH